mmetsp:Transcript_3325/g.7368  ORF Transcript_3325/g.7368 Transcript_3325/m.7368 type:complete len:361 (+) Transcript_3325:95-1177(+)
MMVMASLQKPNLAILSALVFSSGIMLSAYGAGNNMDEPRQGALLQELDESQSLHFAAIGDWGAPLSSPRQRSGQQAVADGVASWLEKITNENNGQDENSPFILSLGDNFYPSGVTNADEMAERFDQSFDDIYSHDAFGDVPWYVVAGNKDYESDITAQMNYSGSSRWIFPDYFHRVVREVRGPRSDVIGGAMKVEIILTDTMQLAGTTQFPTLSKSRDERTPRETADRGLQYIKHHLRHSDADYLIVVGHFPAHSVSGLEELLQIHKVSAYVHGHVHCQQHKRKQGVDYFTSGTGMEIGCRKDDIDHKGATGGFLSFQASVDKMVVRFHDQISHEIYQVVIRPRFENNRGDRLEEPFEIA